MQVRNLDRDESLQVRIERFVDASIAAFAQQHFDLIAVDAFRRLSRLDTRTDAGPRLIDLLGLVESIRRPRVHGLGQHRIQAQFGIIRVN